MSMYVQELYTVPSITFFVILHGTRVRPLWPRPVCRLTPLCIYQIVVVVDIFLFHEYAHRQWTAR